MREVHKQHYACALKIASEQRGISWFVEQAAQDHSLIYRRVALEGKERSAPVAN